MVRAVRDADPVLYQRSSPGAGLGTSVPARPLSRRIATCLHNPAVPMRPQRSPRSLHALRDAERLDVGRFVRLRNGRIGSLLTQVAQRASTTDVDASQAPTCRCRAHRHRPPKGRIWPSVMHPHPGHRPPAPAPRRGAEQVATRSRGRRRWRLGVVLANHAHDKPHHWTLAARTGHVQAPEQIALKGQRPGRWDTRRRGFTRDPVVTGTRRSPDPARTRRLD